MAAIAPITKSPSAKGRIRTAMHDLWNSPERLGSLITAANWGIAITLLVAFACTAIVVKATSQKDALTGALDLAKAQHIAELDNANLTLRGKIATLEIAASGVEQNLADLRIKAANAEASQQQVQIELAKQQERAANAELSLLELQKKLDWREISAKQREKFLAAAVGKHKGIVKIISVSSDAEARAFAEKLRKLLVDGGWESPAVTTGLFITPNDIGLHLNMASTVAPTKVSATEVSIPLDSPIEYGYELVAVFRAAGFVIQSGMSTEASKENDVVLVVGSKP